jgi:hypothetical protein
VARVFVFLAYRVLICRVLFVSLWLPNLPYWIPPQSIRTDNDGIDAQLPGTRERLVCVAFVLERAKVYARFEMGLDARSS